MPAEQIAWSGHGELAVVPCCCGRLLVQEGHRVGQDREVAGRVCQLLLVHIQNRYLKVIMPRIYSPSTLAFIVEIEPATLPAMSKFAVLCRVAWFMFCHGLYRSARSYLSWPPRHRNLYRPQPDLQRGKSVYPCRGLSFSVKEIQTKAHISYSRPKDRFSIFYE